MITILSKFNTVQQTILFWKSDVITEKTKAKANVDLVIHFLENIPQYTNYIYILERVKYYR